MLCTKWYFSQYSPILTFTFFSAASLDLFSDDACCSVWLFVLNCYIFDYSAAENNTWDLKKDFILSAWTETSRFTWSFDRRNLSKWFGFSPGVCFTIYQDIISKFELRNFYISILLNLIFFSLTLFCQSLHYLQFWVLFPVARRNINR